MKKMRHIILVALLLATTLSVSSCFFKPQDPDTQAIDLNSIIATINNVGVSVLEKLNLLQEALNNGDITQEAALDFLKTTFETLKVTVQDNLASRIDSIIDYLRTIDTSVRGSVSDVINRILEAIRGLTNNSDIISAIQNALIPNSE